MRFPLFSCGRVYCINLEVDVAAACVPYFVMDKGKCIWASAFEHMHFEQFVLEYMLVGFERVLAKALCIEGAPELHHVLRYSLSTSIS